MDAEAYDDAPCCRIEFDELEFTSPDDSSPTGGAFGEIRFAKLRYLPPSLWRRCRTSRGSSLHIHARDNDSLSPPGPMDWRS